MSYENILVETHGKVGLIQFNRPKVMNALNETLMAEVSDALFKFEADPAIGAIVLTGSDKVFAAGADIGAMKDWTYADVYNMDYVTHIWEDMVRIRKPIIAAVAGFALGGGCEVAMMCDFIIAAENAEFGQPEVTIGTMPGLGGTQRLTRLVGKAKAMEMCLTGRRIQAEEAERIGLVSRVVTKELLKEEAIKTAAQIANFSQPVVKMIKEAVNRSYETTLKEGLLFERRALHATFALEDQKEGMSAFVEKRRPQFKHK